MNTITIKRNNDRTYNTTIRDKTTLVPINITGYKLIFSVKKRSTDSDDDAIIYFENTVHTVPSEGTTYITINAEGTKDIDTGKYCYDVLLIDDHQKRASSETGQFIVDQEITDGE